MARDRKLSMSLFNQKQFDYPELSASRTMAMAQAQASTGKLVRRISIPLLVTASPILKSFTIAKANPRRD